MSVLADDPSHFHRWLLAREACAGDAAAAATAEAIFPRRAVFADYMTSLLAPALERGVAHVRARALAVAPAAAGFVVELEGGRPLAADIVVLATSHPPPAPPA